MKKILITGHEGLVGRHLWPHLKILGYQLKGIDLVAKEAKFLGDITDNLALNNSIDDCDGIIHLAGVSRVIWGERNPDLCWKTNAQASINLLDLASKSKKKPWVLVASSREVYGEPISFPVNENYPLAPINVYGRAKVAMEEAALKARISGIKTAVVRLANVYGCIQDYHDRVLPAFCLAAVKGETLRVDGSEHTFDFTHISDTVDGLLRIIDKLESGKADLPPIHLLPGIATTLGKAAKLAVKAANSSSSINEAPSRTYDVARFIGDSSLARKLLGWEAKITPSEGIQLLVSAFQQQFKTEVENA
jgi:nucleoside-diphosphate-sugar epimerase